MLPIQTSGQPDENRKRKTKMSSDDKFVLRFNGQVSRDEIKRSADKAGRSMNAEILWRLANSSAKPEVSNSTTGWNPVVGALVTVDGCKDIGTLRAFSSDGQTIFAEVSFFGTIDYVSVDQLKPYIIN